MSGIRNLAIRPLLAESGRTRVTVGCPLARINMWLLFLTEEPLMDTSTKATGRTTPWNKGKILGQKPPLTLKEIWAIRIRLQLDRRVRKLALFNLAIDSKLRGCDLVGIRVHDIVQGSHVAARAVVMQRKTQRPVQFENTEQTRDAVATWIASAHLTPDQSLFPSRLTKSPHLSTRQYSRIVGAWVGSIGLTQRLMAPIPCVAPNRL